MKRLVIASVLLFLFFSSLINAQWIYVTDPAPFFGSFYVTSHNSELYLASNKDIFKTTDEGNSWINLTQGFVIDLGNANRFIQFAGTNIFVGTTVLGIFVSPDNGSTWQMDTMGLESVRQVDLLYTDGTNIFAGMWWPTYGLYTKAAAPGPWTRVNSNSIGSSYGTQVFGMTKIGNTFYAATRSSGVYESNDNGVNWTQKANDNYPAPVDGYTSNRLVSLGSDLFIASTDGVFKSMDLADSWVRVDQGFAVWDQFSVATIRSLYTDGLNLYASMEHDDSAYVSSDAGNTWKDISDGLDHFIWSFTMHNGVLYAAQWDTDSSLVRYDGVLDVEKEEGVVPQQFNLSQNYPNPFNPSTKIKFSVPDNSFVSLKIYDALGREVAELVNEALQTGSYQVEFNGSNLSSGVYFYTLKAGKFSSTKKLVLMK